MIMSDWLPPNPPDIADPLCTTKEGITTRNIKDSKSEVEKLRNKVTKEDGFLNLRDCLKIRVVKFAGFLSAVRKMFWSRIENRDGRMKK